MDSLEQKIAKLVEPTLFTNTKIEEIVDENITLLRELYPSWQPIESDTNMMQLEAFSYKEAMLKTLFNNAIKAMLPHYAKAEDLDNFVFGLYGGETRLEGEEPTALYEFSLEEVLTQDIIVPKGLRLSDGKEAKAFLQEDVHIHAGTLKAVGKVKLEEKTKSSKIQTTIVTSPYPYVLKPKALANFEHGSYRESDEEFFKRAILSLNQYSTAGSEKAYEYFTYKADERVQDVNVHSPSEGLVDIYVYATQGKDEVLDNVRNIFEEEKVQALNDKVSVKEALKKEVNIQATIHLLDLLDEAMAREKINENVNAQFKIGQSLPCSQLIKSLHVAGVFKVELDNHEDVQAAFNEVLGLHVNLNFKKAVL